MVQTQTHYFCLWWTDAQISEHRTSAKEVNFCIPLRIATTLSPIDVKDVHFFAFIVHDLLKII